METMDDNDDWCCKQRDFTHVHKYKSRFCRKIVALEVEVGKSILSTGTKKKAQLRVSFNEEENHTKEVDSVNRAKKQSMSAQKCASEKPKRRNSNLGASKYKTVSNDRRSEDEAEENLLEYDSFEQPTIVLSSARLEVKEEEPLPLSDSVSDLFPSADNVSASPPSDLHQPGHASPNRAAPVSPGCSKLGTKRRRCSFRFSPLAPLIAAQPTSQSEANRTRPNHSRAAAETPKPTSDQCDLFQDVNKENFDPFKIDALVSVDFHPFKPEIEEDGANNAAGFLCGFFDPL